MAGLTALTRTFSNLEKHQMGDHRTCGGACPSSGTDTRPAPIYERALYAAQRAERAAHVPVYAVPWIGPQGPILAQSTDSQNNLDLRSVSRARLRDLAKQAGVHGYSKMNKLQLWQSMLDVEMARVSGPHPMGGDPI